MATALFVPKGKPHITLMPTIHNVCFFCCRMFNNCVDSTMLYQFHHFNKFSHTFQLKLGCSELVEFRATTQIFVLICKFDGVYRQCFYIGQSRKIRKTCFDLIWKRCGLFPTGVFVPQLLMSFLHIIWFLCAHWQHTSIILIVTQLMEHHLPFAYD